MHMQLFDKSKQHLGSYYGTMHKVHKPTSSSSWQHLHAYVSAVYLSFDSWFKLHYKSSKRHDIVRLLAEMTGSSHSMRNIKGVLPPPNVELMSAPTVTRASTTFGLSQKSQAACSKLCFKNWHWLLFNSILEQRSNTPPHYMHAQVQASPAQLESIVEWQSNGNAFSPVSLVCIVCNTPSLASQPSNPVVFMHILVAVLFCQLFCLYLFQEWCPTHSESW